MHIQKCNRKLVLCHITEMQLSHNVHAENVQIKAGNYVIRKEGADIVIEIKNADHWILRC